MLYHKKVSKHPLLLSLYITGTPAINEFPLRLTTPTFRFVVLVFVYIWELSNMLLLNTELRPPNPDIYLKCGGKNSNFM